MQIMFPMRPRHNNRARNENLKEQRRNDVAHYRAVDQF